MDTAFFVLTCCLSLSFAVPATGEQQQTKSTVTARGVLHNTTLLNFPVRANTTTTPTTNTTSLTSTKEANNTSTSTSVMVTNSSHPQTLESMTTTTTLTNTTLLTTDITATKTSVTPTGNYTSATITTTTAVITTANSSTVNTTSQSIQTTQGLRLSISERNLTITFSFMLGVFAVAVAVIMLHRCGHKLQYLHQPLNDTAGLNTFTADSDTLIISGGLYDGHPIYDNIPPARQDESQFHLEFHH